MSLADDYVVLQRGDWEALLAALAAGDAQEAALVALVAPVSADTYVLREDDPLAAQALYGYGATIRTAIEFTQQQGLCVMTEETGTALADLAEQVTLLGCAWQERQEASGATVQRVEGGTLET